MPKPTPISTEPFWDLVGPFSIATWVKWTPSQSPVPQVPALPFKRNKVHYLLRKFTLGNAKKTNPPREYEFGLEKNLLHNFLKKQNENPDCIYFVAVFFCLCPFFFPVVFVCLCQKKGPEAPILCLAKSSKCGSYDQVINGSIPQNTAAFLATFV